jgi:hypothetical protein
MSGKPWRDIFALLPPLTASEEVKGYIWEEIAHRTGAPPSSRPLLLYFDGRKTCVSACGRVFRPPCA